MNRHANTIAYAFLLGTHTILLQCAAESTKPSEPTHSFDINKIAFQSNINHFEEAHKALQSIATSKLVSEQPAKILITICFALERLSNKSDTTRIPYYRAKPLPFFGSSPLAEKIKARQHYYHGLTQLQEALEKNGASACKSGTTLLGHIDTVLNAIIKDSEDTTVSSVDYSTALDYVQRHGTPTGPKRNQPDVCKNQPTISAFFEPTSAKKPRNR